MTPDHIMAVKHRWKRRKFWLPPFSAFPTMFSKDLFLSVVKTQDFVAKGYYAIAKREKFFYLKVFCNLWCSRSDQRCFVLEKIGS